MSFIKVGNTVINTNYIAAIKLDNQTCSGERCVSILMTTSRILMSQKETPLPNLYHYEWLDFTGVEVNVLRDYFSSFSNVIDLLPQPQRTSL